jgi:hypothetical protein
MSTPGQNTNEQRGQNDKVKIKNKIYKEKRREIDKVKNGIRKPEREDGRDGLFKRKENKNKNEGGVSV